MILINKNEKEAILARFPKTFITRTCKSKSNRHKYYCVEDRKVLAFLNKRRRNNDRKQFASA